MTAEVEVRQIQEVLVTALCIRLLFPQPPIVWYKYCASRLLDKHFKYLYLPSTVLSWQIVAPVQQINMFGTRVQASNNLPWIKASGFCHVRQKTNKIAALTSLVMVDAKARAKPASAALILGDATATKPVTPIIPLEIRLKRTESQRLTKSGLVSHITQTTKQSPHLPTSSSTDWRSITPAKKSEVLKF